LQTRADGGGFKPISVRPHQYLAVACVQLSKRSLNGDDFFGNKQLSKGIGSRRCGRRFTGNALEGPGFSASSALAMEAVVPRCFEKKGGQGLHIPDAPLAKRLQRDAQCFLRHFFGDSSVSESPRREDVQPIEKTIAQTCGEVIRIAIAGLTSQRHLTIRGPALTPLQLRAIIMHSGSAALQHGGTAALRHALTR
jgi:hypothetical protein